jgi:hypothetical protein
MFRKMAVLFVALAPVATFAFGLPKAPSAGGDGGGLTGAMIDNFADKAAKADVMMSKTNAALFDAVASKEEREAREAELKAAQEIKDPKERDAAVKKAEASTSAKLASMKWEGDIAERVKQLSGAQLKAVGDAAGNFIVAAAANIGLVRQGQEMAKQKPEMAAAPKMPTLTASVGNLVNQTKSAISVASGLQKLMKSAKIELPAEATASISQFNAGI